MAKPINWKEYDETFPRRYFAVSLVDCEVMKFVNERRKVVALDIGGGKYGTSALNSRHIDAYLLDPFVDKPDWMKGHLTWENVGEYHFDIAVARASLAYLSAFQLYQISKCADSFVANSFVRQPTHGMERRYTNKAGTITGTEKARYDRATGIVTHTLIPDNGKEPTEHCFFCHSVEKLQDHMPERELVFYKHGYNSMLIQYGAFTQTGDNT